MDSARTAVAKRRRRGGDEKEWNKYSEVRDLVQ